MEEPQWELRGDSLHLTLGTILDLLQDCDGGKLLSSFALEEGGETQRDR